jgi:hypothetical protein
MQRTVEGATQGGSQVRCAGQGTLCFDDNLHRVLYLVKCWAGCRHWSLAREPLAGPSLCICVCAWNVQVAG